jgi:hypothetical protein
VFGVLAEKANSKNAACVHVQDTTKSARDDASKINAIHALPPTTPLAHLCVLIQATPKASQSIPRTERPERCMRSQMSAEMGRTRGYPVFYCSLVPTRRLDSTRLDSTLGSRKRGRRRKGEEAKKSSVGPVLESSLDSIIHVDLDLFCTCTGNFILSIIMD